MLRITDVFYRHHRLCDLPIKNCTSDDICFDLSVFERIKPYIATCINQLTKMRLVIFHSNETNKVSPGRHSCRVVATLENMVCQSKRKFIMSDGLRWDELVMLGGMGVMGPTIAKPRGPTSPVARQTPMAHQVWWAME